MSTVSKKDSPIMEQTALGRHGRALLGVILLGAVIGGGIWYRTSGAHGAFDKGRDTIYAGEALEGRRILNEYLSSHPEGKYASQAHYFIGKSYMLEDNREQARATFLYVRERFPDTTLAQQAEYDIAMLDLWRGNRELALRTFRKIAKVKKGPCVPEATAMAEWLERGQVNLIHESNERVASSAEHGAAEAD